MNAVGQSNPFSDASEFNTLAFIIARATDEMQTVSIVQVKAVDTGALTVDVQVLVNLVTGANISVPHGVISARPYFRAQGGASGIILDPVAGDIGLMVFASRDSSAVISAKGLANPGSQRRFSWSDGVYLGGVLNSTPTQYIKFLPAGAGITLLTPGAAKIQSATLEVTGAATFDSTVNIDGTTTAAVINAMTVNATTVAATTVDGTNLNISGGTVSLPAGSISDAALATQAGVTPGSYTGANLTVNAQGIITAVSSGGGGGGSLSITDGVHTVAAVTALTVVGGTVSGSTPNCTLTITSSGGTVTSVGLTVNATYIALGGTASPITTSGTYTLDLSTAAKVSLALATTALQSISIATGTGLTGGPLTDSGTTVSLAVIADQKILGNISGGSAAPVAINLPQNLESAGWNSPADAVLTALTVPQDILVPYACTLREVYILTQGGTGSCTVTIGKIALASIPGAFVDITGGVPPALTSSNAPYTNSVLSGWTTSFNQDDVLRLTLTANSVFTSIKVLLRMY